MVSGHLAIFFDLNGTLSDDMDVHVYALRSALEEAGVMRGGVTFDDNDIHIIRTNYGKPDGIIINALLNKYSVVYSPDMAHRVERIYSGIYTDAIKDGVKLFDGVPRLIHRINDAGIPLGLVSSNTRDVVDAITSRFRDVFDKFDVILSSTDTVYYKPSPMPYMIALGEMARIVGKDLSPSRCRAVEDSVAGVMAAKGAGLYTVAVRHTNPDISMIGPDMVIDHIAELTI